MYENTCCPMIVGHKGSVHGTHASFIKESCRIFVWWLHGCLPNLVRMYPSPLHACKVKTRQVPHNAPLTEVGCVKQSTNIVVET